MFIDTTLPLSNFTFCDKFELLSKYTRASLLCRHVCFFYFVFARTDAKSSYAIDCVFCCRNQFLPLPLSTPLSAETATSSVGPAFIPPPLSSHDPYASCAAGQRMGRANTIFSPVRWYDQQ